MEKRFYKAFTLIEMLIVMGIIMILIGVGVAGTRYALDSANKIKLQNAVDNLNQAMLSYYADEREYVEVGTPALGFIGDALESGGALNKYIEQGEFDGGADSSYYYWVDPVSEQTFLICVSLGGIGDEKEKGFYCNGNGFGATADGLSGVTEKEIAGVTGADDPGLGTCSVSDWTNSTNAWTSSTAACD
jgi:type II secretory pathway pseudopilin PulG